MRTGRIGKAGWLVLALLLAAGGAALYWGVVRQASAPRAAAAPPGVPVVLAQVERKDVAQNLSGIGTVTSLHNVVLRTQVDGQLTQVLVEEGQLVERGQLLATIDDRAIKALLAQAEAARLNSEAQLRIVDQDLQRYRLLYADRAVSKQVLDQQEAQAAQLRATLKSNQALIDAERVRLSYTRITSPVSGRVGIRNVDPGNLLRVSDAIGLFTVTQISPISVVFSLPQESLSQLHTLLGGATPVIAYTRDGGRKLAEGRLQSLDNQVASSTGTVRVRAIFDNAGSQLWPGQFVAVSVQAGVLDDRLVLPSKAVRRGLEGNFVFRVEDGKAQAVPVTVAQDVDGVSVVEGLAAGDQVVLDGHSRLTPGARVEVVGGGDAVARRRAQP
ncbi:efflux RND transporter periplasmic adaptor subunit [Pseudomonas schmalbachii]|uniref:Efflux RND transporter periplasmic adaptor subunit n=1 Tax=Pseudomonas schmalbachii TaxID=2816993 RepID=A0ABS3TLA9_9PSED|nr:efflux RND transporter periplasmic adaptor subunit [Pseudomonas schmalbachii]MBO3274432.1 efflux RND transporter periplasmic adaptor subunit [Pseudomonas schmalbachii]